jgi:choice-of-anchor A domain-containing protein
MKRILALSLLLAPISSAAMAASLDAGQLLSQFNLITLQDLSFSSHSNGRVYVGGDFTAQNSVIYDRNNGPASDYDELLVRGSVTGSNLQVNNAGNMAVGGDVTLGVLELNGHGTANVGGALNALANQGTKNQHVANIDNFFPENVGSVLQGASAALSALASNAAAALSGNKMTLSGAAASGTQAVFNLAFADFSLINEIELALNGATSMIINVSGAGGTLEDNFLGASRAAAPGVIWNFYEAKDLTFNRTFEGSVLAAYADVTSNYSNFEGTLVAMNAKLTGEMHAQYYTGALPQVDAPPPASVPLPAGLPLLAGAVAALAALRRRRRA